MAIFWPITLYAQSESFPIEGNVKHRVNFWIKVYTEITTQQAFLHDSEDLQIVYKKVNLPKSSRQRRKYLRQQRNHYKRLLRDLSSRKAANLSQEHLDLIKIVGKRSSKEYYQLSRNLRFQYGLKDRYFKGLVRSYQYMDYIKGLLEEQGLPEEIRFLPHVESSFNAHAYSKVGAAGMWQFMRSTGRLYRLKIAYTIDERRDPFKATKAALRLLKDNYRMLKSWPLALTAYNHGARSMQRAISKLGTRDIHTIIDNYRNPRFGFASKNFYATFMATVQISKYPQVYFPHFQKPKVTPLSHLTLPAPLTASQIIKALKVKKSTFVNLNPSIRRSAYNMALPIPKGHIVYIPQLTSTELAQAETRLKEEKLLGPDLTKEKLHIVSRGETLFDISQYYKVQMRDIIVFNQISNPSRIYTGMRLKIPGKDTKVDKIEEEQKVAVALKVKTPIKVEKKIKEKVEPQVVSEAPIAKTITKPQYGPFPPMAIANLDGYDLEAKPIKGNLYQIRVETDETLGHYADWLNIKTQTIRRWNRFAYGRVILLGQKINLYLTDKQLLTFKQERNTYHLSIQEDFFENYQVTDKKEYTVKRGDTLNSILKDAELPFWLVRRQQPDQKLSDRLSVGQKVQLPILEALQEGDNETPISLQSEDT